MLLLWPDPAWLSEALTNLVKNALEHTKGGRVEITGEETPMTVQLTIRDNGSGISPAERAALFERFNRHSSALSEASTGIGLSIAKRITEDQGGELILEPNSDRGIRQYKTETCKKNPFPFPKFCAMIKAQDSTGHIVQL